MSIMMTITGGIEPPVPTNNLSYNYNQRYKKVKIAALTIMFLMLCISGFAQTGIFGISFGQSAADLDKVMKSKGFTSVVREYEGKVYTNPKINYLVEVQVFMDKTTNKAYTWNAYFYNEADSDKALEAAKALVYAIHGEEYVWDYWDDVYVWDIGSGKGAYLYLNDDNEWTIEYSDWDDYYEDFY